MTEHSSSLPAALRRRREYAGPVLFSYGFRPFFLGGALWAALSVLLWLPQYFGELSLPTAFTPLDWHIHEMLYGYVAAIVTGFLLTAIPNWTGRFPVNGLPLAALAALWLAGRVAVAGSAIWGAELAAAIDVAFLAALAALAHDNDFLADTRRAGINVSPLAGEAVERIIAMISSAPPETTERLGKAIGSEK